MKKAVIFIILVLVSANAYPFWIWSPKTNKWKNPKYSPLATPFLQYKEALKYFDKEDYQQAFKEFRKITIHYPDAKEAAEAQYYLGRCLEGMDKPYQAFQEYQKVIDSYPNSKRINEIVGLEYKIGEYFLEREPKKWLGISVYDLIEHPAIEIFKTIVDKVPYSSQAPQAQYKLGILLFQLNRFDEAKDAFQRVIDNYPDSEWFTPAKYQLAIATAKASGGTDYDSTPIEEATQRLDEFIKKHPDATVSSSARQQLNDLKDKETKKNFDIAEFYEKQKKYKSALFYYRLVLKNYPDSEYAGPAREKIEELKDKL